MRNEILLKTKSAQIRINTSSTIIYIGITIRSRSKKKKSLVNIIRVLKITLFARIPECRISWINHRLSESLFFFFFKKTYYLTSIFSLFIFSILVTDIALSKNYINIIDKIVKYSSYSHVNNNYNCSIRITFTLNVYLVI